MMKNEELKLFEKKTEVAWKIFWKSGVSKIIWKLKFWQLNLKKMEIWKLFEN